MLGSSGVGSGVTSVLSFKVAVFALKGIVLTCFGAEFSYFLVQLADHSIFFYYEDLSCLFKDSLIINTAS